MGKYLTLKLSFSALAIALVSAAAAAQSAPAAPTHKPIHHTAAKSAAASGIKLPPSIPAAPGPVQTLYELRYVDIKLGTGAPAMPGQAYTVNYTGWLYDGTKFDSSVDRNQPFDFIQGQQRVIIGWDTGFEGMKVGGKRRLFVPYQLGYGTAGHDPIPPKANLIFDVELLGVNGAGAPQAAP
ncbi:MAG TPA: FKBP-type peptidyl-prolyl cis-trans isomerase [Acidisarcina sp.]